MPNRNKLKGRIIEKYGTQERFAEIMKTTPQTVTKKINGKSMFNQNDIFEWSAALEIEKAQIGEYFFD